jgi:HPt (histidine-containing phosphotransfer) domain-containing protein
METGAIDKVEKISDYLRNEFELDEEDIQEMFQEYFGNMDSLIERACSQITDAKWDELKKTAHSIKGASANIGAEVISSAGKMIEDHALEANAEECMSFLDKIKCGVASLKAEKHGAKEI